MEDHTPQPTDTQAAPLVEVVVNFEGNTYTVYAASKEEGERIVHAHIDAVKNPAPPAE
jgi:hypothetical protein